jgi:alanine-glyoxylate transaminase/serine-glyoxylate transaminase/serine-pyruvate transaminase
MAKPLLGYLDAAFIAILDELVTMLKIAYRRPDGLTIPLSSTGTSAMEAGIAALTEPGDTLIVGIAGYFGRRIAEIATRHGVQVVEAVSTPGDQVSIEDVLELLNAHPEARLVALVHAETSAGVRQQLGELSRALAFGDTLLMVDCVTSFAGNELEPANWSIDYAYSCTQKCLGAPPGMAPVTLSERAMERIRSRHAPTPFTLDFERLARYWVERPAAYHHTPPALNVYALHEALRLLLEEGLEQRWTRHTIAGRRLQAGLEELGLQLLANEESRLPQLTAVQVPEGIDGRAVQRELLDQHGLEIGGGLDASAPPIWRIGLMGPNATPATADRVLDAFETVLAQHASLTTKSRR